MVLILAALSLVWTPLGAAPPATHRIEPYFEPNRGQFDPSIRYVARGAGFDMALRDGDAWFGAGDQRWRMRLSGARPSTPSRASGQLPGISNYFIGSDPSRWSAGVPHFSRIHFDQAYPAIDLVYYVRNQRIEFDFIAAPGADPNQIELTWDGPGGIRIDTSGDLLLAGSGGELRLHRPQVYQDIGGWVVPIDARYRIAGPRSVRFELAHYDHAHPLTIDPALSYSTYLGGTGRDQPVAIAVDAAGNAYVCGNTTSTDFPLRNVYQTRPASIFVTKLNATADVVYSTYLGGTSGTSQVSGLTIDDATAVYLTGGTQDTDFPVKNAYQATLSGTATDAFVTKLSPSGTALLFSTYLGGASADYGAGIRVDSTGVYVAGSTQSLGFPVTAGALNLREGQNRYDVFVTKFQPDGSRLIYSAVFGSADLASPVNAMAIDGAGNVYVPIAAGKPDFITTPTAFRTTGGNGGNGVEAVVAKLNAAGAALSYSTYIGPIGPGDYVRLDVDEAGRAYLTGATQYAGFPATANAWRSSPHASDIYVTKLNSLGTDLVASTFFGGSAADIGHSIKADDAGRAWVAGISTSPDTPRINDPIDATASPNSVVLAVIDPAGSAVLFSMAGSVATEARSVALDASGNAYLAVHAISPTTDDAMVMKLTGVVPPVCAAPVPDIAAVVPVNGGLGNLFVASAADCRWYVTRSSRFVRAIRQSGAIGPDWVTYIVDANPGAGPRTASLTMAGRIVPIIQSGTDATPPFTDVPNDHPAADYIRVIKSQGITSGCSAALYCPDAAVTRGQMAVFVMRGMLGNSSFPYPETPYFSDVPASHPYFPWIQKMREMGITTGCTATAYCPNATVTRGQMAVFLIRATLGNRFRYSATPYFDDVPVSHAYFSYIQKMREWGITSGCSAGRYCPLDAATRAQMAVFLTRIFLTPR